MTQFLDARSSQNASYGGSISVTLPASIPTAVGDIGLNTAGSTGAIRVILNGIAELQFATPPDPDSVAVIAIVRGTTPEDTIVAFAIYPITSTGTFQALNITATDTNVPTPPSGELIYTFFLFSTSEAIRIGMESFNGAAYSD
ncbi:hypothetical protein [Paenibacillus sp. USHLN196]|uniref:hypothetical protein n=1 Tax=Paenibacillus sp. USHLN196 TaxID=3081291 RepID=UPI0030161609